MQTVLTILRFPFSFYKIVVLLDLHDVTMLEEASSPLERKNKLFETNFFSFRGPYWPSWIRIHIAASSVMDSGSLNPDPDTYPNPAFVYFPFPVVSFGPASENDSYEAPEPPSLQVPIPLPPFFFYIPVRNSFIL
jgi:hypothetical protein